MWGNARAGVFILKTVTILFSNASRFSLNPKTSLCKSTLVPVITLKMRTPSSLAPLWLEIPTFGFALLWSFVFFFQKPKLISDYTKIRKTRWLYIPSTPIYDSWTEMSPPQWNGCARAPSKVSYIVWIRQTVQKKFFVFCFFKKHGTNRKSNLSGSIIFLLTAYCWIWRKGPIIIYLDIPNLYFHKAQREFFSFQRQGNYTAKKKDFLKILRTHLFLMHYKLKAFEAS